MEMDKKYAVPGIDRAVGIIEYIAEKKCVGFNALFKAMGIPKSTLYNTLRTLLRLEYLCHSPKGYRLGIEIYSLGQAALGQLSGGALNHAKSLIGNLALASKEASFFGILDGNEAFYIAKTDRATDKMSCSSVGMPVAWQVTAIGKALLAWTNEKSVHEIIEATTPTRYTDRSILEPGSFMQHLETIRQHGFAAIDRENTDNSVCVAAPVFCSQQERPIGALSIVTPFERMTPDFFVFASECVYGAGKMMSENLGALNYPEFAPLSYQTA